MNKYTVAATFFCESLKKYISIDTIIYRSEISSKLIIDGTQDSNNKTNTVLSKFEYITPDDISWFDDLVSEESPLITFVETLEESVNGGVESGGNFITLSGGYDIQPTDKYFYAPPYYYNITTLPVPTQGKELVFMNNSGSEGHIVIRPNDAENINNSSGDYTFFSSSYSTKRLVSDGTDWFFC